MNTETKTENRNNKHILNAVDKFIFNMTKDSLAEVQQAGISLEELVIKLYDLFEDDGGFSWGFTFMLEEEKETDPESYYDELAESIYAYSDITDGEGESIVEILNRSATMFKEPTKK